MRPSATRPSGIASRPTWTSTSAPSSTTVPADLSSPTGPRSSTSRRRPGGGRRSGTLTSSGDCSSSILIEERLVLAGIFRPGQRRVLGRRQRGDPQLLPTRDHGLDRALQDDLEGGQLLVAVVLGLVLQAVGDVARVLHGVAGDELGLAH